MMRVLTPAKTAASSGAINRVGNEQVVQYNGACWRVPRKISDLVSTVISVRLRFIMLSPVALLSQSSAGRSARPQVVPVLPQVVAVLPQVVAVLPQVVPVLPQAVPVLPQVVAVLPQVVAVLTQVVAVLPQVVSVLPQAVAVLPQVVAVLPQVVAVLPQVVPVPRRNECDFAARSEEHT